jgi:hypothetical protein
MAERVVEEPRNDTRTPNRARDGDVGSISRQNRRNAVIGSNTRRTKERRRKEA